MSLGRFSYRRYTGAFPAVALGVRAIREEVAAVAAECGLSAAQIHDLKLAVSEAASNAVVHAYQGGEGEVRVTVDYESGELLVVIADDGRGMAPRLDTPGAGLGLPMIATVASRMEVVSPGRGTEVHMVFPCPKGVKTPGQ